MEQKQAEPAQPQARAAAPTAAAAAAAPAAPTAVLSPLERKYAQLHLPQWAGPSFHSRLHPSSGALLIEADVAGVLAADLLVSSDPVARTLTIRGVKLPQRRRSLPAHSGMFALGRSLPATVAVEPHGFFSKIIDFAALDPNTLLDLASMSATIDNRQGLLQVTVPRQTKKAPQQQQQHYQQQQQHRAAASRQPIQHSSGATYSDDEEQDMRSQYYPQQQQQQRYAPRRAPQQSAGWW